MNPGAWRRIAAWLVDWLCFLVWLALVAAVGIPLYLSGVTGQWSAVTTNVVSALATAVPLTVFLAVLESGARQAAIGLVGSAEVGPGLAALTAAAYVLPIVYVITLFTGEGRTPYDRAGGARVVRA